MRKGKWYWRRVNNSPLAESGNQNTKGDRSETSCRGRDTLQGVLVFMKEYVEMKGETNLIWEVYLMITYSLSTKLVKTVGDTVKGKVHMTSIVESSENHDIARDIYKCMLKGLIETLGQEGKEGRQDGNNK